jgi:enamine deaminase RidA (YjgF/YER057c/UK114 family)
MSAEARLKELGIALPTPPTPLANYVPGVLAGNLLFLSGHGPIRSEGKPSARGKVGRDLTVEEGYKVAREVGINLLASARVILGSLDRVKRVVKVLGMVNSAEGLGDQPKVINGCSDLLVQVFGDNGRHARSAVGMAELPVGIPVEIEMILEVAPPGPAGATAARTRPARSGRTATAHGGRPARRPVKPARKPRR